MHTVSDWPVPMSVGEQGMTLGDVCAVLEAEPLVQGPPDTPVRSVGAADLLSDVLALGTPGMLLLTGLVTAQTVRTASVADLAGVVFVRNKRVGDDVLALARDSGMPIMRTRLTLFEASGRLYARLAARRAGP
jgi:hypothetical protein